MNTPLSWIKAYVPDLEVTAQGYADAMTLSGTKVEGYEKMDADLDNDTVVQNVLANDKIASFLQKNGGEIRKTIVVKNKLVNLIVK